MHSKQTLRRPWDNVLGAYGMCIRKISLARTICEIITNNTKIATSNYFVIFLAGMANSFYEGSSFVLKRAEYGFGERSFKHRAQWVFGPHRVPGKNSVSSSQPIIVCQSELTEFDFAEITVCCRTSALETVFCPFGRTIDSERILIQGCAGCSLLLWPDLNLGVQGRMSYRRTRKASPTAIMASAPHLPYAVRV